MKLWLLTSNKQVGYDGFLGFVVAARSGVAARRFADNRAGKNDYTHWRDTEQATCEQIGIHIKQDAEEGIVLESFNAG